MVSQPLGLTAMSSFVLHYFDFHIDHNRFLASYHHHLRICHEYTFIRAITVTPSVPADVYSQHKMRTIQPDEITAGNSHEGLSKFAVSHSLIIAVSRRTSQQCCPPGCNEAPTQGQHFHGTEDSTHNNDEEILRGQHYFVSYVGSREIGSSSP